jgi:deazaflavin-dependent oxidoreductase (nitroreductase family)
MDTEFNRRGVALPRWTAHDQFMSDAIRQEAAAAEIAKHRRLLRSGRDGRILSALMFPLLRWAPQAGYGVLTTTGRKTGKSRQKCVRVVRGGDRAYLVALHPPHLTLANPAAVQAWVHNIRANPNVRLRIRGGTFDGIAREIVDADERQLARSMLCEPVYAGDYGECALHLRGLPSRTKVQELHQYWFETGIPIAIDLKGPSR